MNVPILLVALLGVGGCASSYTASDLPGDHPGSVDGEDAAMHSRSRTLDLRGADPISPVQSRKATDHSGHGMADGPEPGDANGMREPRAHEHGTESPPTPAAAVQYACPMHPEVTSDKPDQRCPKCGMKLIAVSEPGGVP